MDREDDKLYALYKMKDRGRKVKVGRLYNIGEMDPKPRNILE